MSARQKKVTVYGRIGNEHSKNWDVVEIEFDYLDENFVEWLSDESLGFLERCSTDNIVESFTQSVFAATILPDRNDMASLREWASTRINTAVAQKRRYNNDGGSEI